MPALPAERVYEDLLGFPDRRASSAFRRACRELLAPLPAPRTAGPRRFLSIGTGYGRVDMPFLKAYVELRSCAGAVIEAEFVEPSPRFRALLRGRLRRGEEGLQRHPRVRLRLLASRIEATLARLPQDRRYDCILASVSLQHMREPGRVLAALRRHLAPGGMLVTASAGGPGAWISRPPSGVLGPRRWRELWTRWHCELERFNARPAPRVRPDDPRALGRVLAQAGFSRAVREIEFHWRRRVSGATLARTLALTRADRWRGLVTALAPLPAAQARAFVAGLRDAGPWASRAGADCAYTLTLAVYRGRR